MRAVDMDEEKLKFPVIIQPKVDGVRGGIHPNGKLTTRQLKPFDNLHTARVFSKQDYAGVDGELYLGTDPAVPDLCRLTTSATSTILGKPHIQIMAFDLVLPTTIDTAYVDRLWELGRFIEREHRGNSLIGLVPWAAAHDLEALIKKEEEWLTAGYEGLIARGMANTHKEGYSTAREGGLLRLKRFVDGEIKITKLVEGQHNANEAKVGLTGHKERSSHKANKSGNGQVGSMEGVVVKDVKWRGKVVLAQGQVITVSAGRMTKLEKEAAWANPKLLVGQYGKFQFFPIGIKDKPRFPTFLSLRNKKDL